MSSRVGAVRVHGIHHVGYAVADIDEALPLYTERFGMPLELRETLDQQGVEAVSLGAGPGHVELIRPLDADGAVARFLARRGPGMHHVAYRVADLAAALEELSRDGMRLIDDAPRVGLGGHLVAFLHPAGTGGVLTELVEADPPSR
jgi:methylmalonyl-CoA epimerase